MREKNKIKSFKVYSTFKTRKAHKYNWSRTNNELSNAKKLIN